MGRHLLWQCDAGISGDMAVASLLDLGADETRLRRALTSLPLTGYEVEISRVEKSGIDVCDFAVHLDEAHENHDHAMDYLHGGGDSASPTAAHHHHEHRNLADVCAIIEAGALSPRAQSIAKRIFEIVAEAEARVHGRAIDEVHFHEVGAVDSIVDIVSVAVCIDDLAIEDVIMERLVDGRGCIRCQHGLIPVPAPAVTEIVRAFELPLSILPIDGELVTPTGAAIVAALRTMDAPPDPMVIIAQGMGAGKRRYPTTGILRALLVEAARDDIRRASPTRGRDKSL